MQSDLLMFLRALQRAFLGCLSSETALERKSTLIKHINRNSHCPHDTPASLPAYVIHRSGAMFRVCTTLLSCSERNVHKARALERHDLICHTAFSVYRVRYISDFIRDAVIGILLLVSVTLGLTGAPRVTDKSRAGSRYKANTVRVQWCQRRYSLRRDQSTDTLHNGHSSALARV